MNVDLGTVKSHTRPRLDGIESLRAVAALMIVLYHMVLLPTPNIALPGYLLVIKERFGLGVPLFYALSGFVLAYGYMDKITDRRSIIKFYLRRYFRISPLFYFMVITWMAATRIKWGHFPATFHDLTLNFLLLFGLVPGKHESIAWAGWSIGVEIIFYISFPLIAVMVNNVRTGTLAFTVAILVSSSFYSAASALHIGSYAYLNIITHYPTFIAGVLGYLIWRKTGFAKNKIIGLILFLATLSFALCVIYLPSVYIILIAAKGVRLDLYVWSIIFMMLILSISFWPNKFVTNAITTNCGKISYSIYLWHPLVIIALLDIYVLIGSHFGYGFKNFIACAAVTLSSVIIVAIISYRFIEKPGIIYGRKLIDSI